MAHQGHLVQPHLGAAGLNFGNAPGLLLRSDFQGFEVLERRGQLGLGNRVFALDFLEGGAQIFAPRFDGTQERGEWPSSHPVVSPVSCDGRPSRDLGSGEMTPRLPGIPFGVG